MAFGREQFRRAPRPLVLAMETSGTYGSLALVGDGVCLAELGLESRLTHSQRLLAGVERLLAEAGLELEALDALAVSLGPGSFTGLRIGLATCKGLAMALAKPVCGVPSLDALASQLSHASRLICPLFDARKQEVYTAFYRAETGSGKVVRESAYRAVPPELLARGIEEPVLLVGDGARLYAPLLRELLGELALFSPGALFFPRAASVGMLAVEQLKRGEVLDIETAVPIYVRPSEAEMKQRAVDSGQWTVDGEFRRSG